MRTKDGNPRNRIVNQSGGILAAFREGFTDSFLNIHRTISELSAYVTGSRIRSGLKRRRHDIPAALGCIKHCLGYYITLTLSSFNQYCRYGIAISSS